MRAVGGLYSVPMPSYSLYFDKTREPIVSDDANPSPPPDAATGAAPPEGAVRGPDQLRDTIVALFGQAHRAVRLASPYLDRRIFNTGAMANAIASFARQHARNRAYILIEDATQVRQDNDRLIVLLRRLADGVELREVDETDRGARDLYLLTDFTACLFQEDVGRSDAVVSRKPNEIAARLGRFDAAWERANPIAIGTLGL
jgi:hypothetical protein